jgi:hypothetical protein
MDRRDGGGELVDLVLDLVAFGNGQSTGAELRTERLDFIILRAGEAGQVYLGGIAPSPELCALQELAVSEVEMQPLRVAVVVVVLEFHPVRVVRDALVAETRNGVRNTEREEREVPDSGEQTQQKTRHDPGLWSTSSPDGTSLGEGEERNPDVSSVGHRPSQGCLEGVEEIGQVQPLPGRQ